MSWASIAKGKEMMEDLAALAWDQMHPDSEQDFEDLPESERSRWQELVRLIRESPRRKQKVSWDQVCQIRRTADWWGASYQELAEKYNISKSTVGQIIRCEIRVKS